MTGADIIETPIMFENRNTGRSKMSWREIIYGGWQLLTLRKRIKQDSK
jgi:hypothetical protein